jgi:hypothetical protein
LELERQKLIDLFKKEKLQLDLIEKKIQKLEQNTNSNSLLKKSNSTENSIFLREQASVLADGDMHNGAFDLIQNKSAVSLNNSNNVNTNQAINKIASDQSSNSSILSTNHMVHKYIESDQNQNLKKIDSNSLNDGQVKLFFHGETLTHHHGTSISFPSQEKGSIRKNLRNSVCWI